MIIFIGFIILGVNSLIKGIEHRQNWRVALAVPGIFIFVALTIMAIAMINKEKKTTT